MIERETHDGVTVLRMAHEKASALDLEFAEALGRAFAEEAAGDARALVLTGTGGIFSAGVDLVRIVDDGPEYIGRFLRVLRVLIRRLLEHPGPVVAAINGHAIAGGCVLACGCDHRIMALGRGRIGMPELAVGVPFPTAALEAVRLVTSGHRLQTTLYEGRTLLPEEALQWGLVDACVEADALLETALERGRALAAIPSESFRLTKAQLRAPALSRIAAAEADGTEDAVAAAWVRPDILEAVRRYVRWTLGK